MTDQPEKHKTVPQDSKACARSGCIFSRAGCLLLRVFVAVVIVSALWVCPSAPFSFEYNAEHPKLICREIASAHSHIAPLVHSTAAELHTLAEPYAGKYMTAAGNAWSKVKPAVVQAGTNAHHTYVSRIEPAAQALAKQAYQHFRPHHRKLQRHYKTHVDPHVSAAHAAIKPYVDI